MARDVERSWESIDRSEAEELLQLVKGSLKYCGREEGQGQVSLSIMLSALATGFLAATGQILTQM